MVCGGFSENPYLKAKLEKVIADLNSDLAFAMDRSIELEFASEMSR